MSFYVGCYLISEGTLDPKHDRTGWAFPDDEDQHMADTSNVEELHVVPTEMDVLPTQIQFGACEYIDDEGFTIDRTYRQFYVREEPFYVRGFTKGSELYSQFYVREENFYIRGFTAGSDLYNTFYVRTENFYIRDFTAGSDLYNTFYVREESFYVRSFTATDHWAEFYVPQC